MEFGKPQDEHRWLSRLEGSWSYEGACDSGPDQPEMKTAGTEIVRSLEGLWIVAEGETAMPDGGCGLTRMTLGFDPTSNRFVGTWVGSMMTHMWVYDGALDERGTVLTLDTVGPSFSGDGGKAAYQDIISIVDDDTRTLTSRVRLDDGSWRQFLVATYRRTDG